METLRGWGRYRVPCTPPSSAPGGQSCAGLCSHIRQPPLTLTVCCHSWCPSSVSTGTSRCCGREPPPSTAAPSACSSLTPSASSSSSSSATCRWTDPHLPGSLWPPGTGTSQQGTTGHGGAVQTGIPLPGTPWQDAYGGDLSSSTPPTPRTASPAGPGADTLLFPSVSC